MSIHIESPTSQDLIPSELKPAIARVTDIYIQTFGSRLQSVYLLGGATRGEYRLGSSDFDMRAIVTKKDDGEKEKVDKIAAPLQKEFNLGDMELDIYTLETINNRDWLQFYVLTDGICIWGNPYEPPIPLPTSNEDLARMLAAHLLDHYEIMPETLERIKAGKEKGNPKAWQKFAKRAIRLGNTISIFKTGEYTQNSNRMIENITRNVPEISEAISKLNQYRISPPEALDGFIDLAREAEIVRTSVIEYGLNDNAEQ